MKKDRFTDFKVFVELEGEKRISVDNLFNLLENIERYGSISRASAEIGLSYRYSWGLIQNAERALGIVLVKKQIGGYEGGGTTSPGRVKNFLASRSLKAKWIRS